jgi:GAF domain-containing protein
LQHCTSSNDCYEAALDAIARALACERASILLFDETQIMRFAAWRGLSQGYRQAVEGHSPWTPDAHDPQPIGIEDVAKADLPDALRQTVLGEDIRAAAFIPILLDGRLSGKFMAYHRLPHSFSEAEIDVRWSLRDCLALAFPPRRRGSAPGSGTRCASARGDC